MKILKAYAIVKKKNPRINLLDIYENKDIKVEKNERLIKVMIKEI